MWLVEFGWRSVISFVWQGNYVCQVYGLGERKGGS